MDSDEEITKDSSEQSLSEEEGDDDIYEIARAMSSDGLRSLRRCPATPVEGEAPLSPQQSCDTFSGAAAFDWLEENLFLQDRSRGKEIGERMLMEGLLLQLNTEEKPPTHYAPEDAFFEDKPNCTYTFSAQVLSHQDKAQIHRKRNRVGGGLSISNYSEVFEALRDPGNGLPLNSHKARKSVGSVNLPKFIGSQGICHESFRGSEAVNWMLLNLPFRTRAEAIDYGQELLRQGYFMVARPEKIRDKPTLKSQDSSPRIELPVPEPVIPSGDEIFKDSDALYQLSKRKDFPKEMLITQRYGLKDFEIGPRLGRGAVGKVFKVIKKDTGKCYAMKIVEKKKFLPSKRSEPSFKLRHLITERNVLLNDHPFLATLHYSFQTKSRIYLVMDYIQGGSLKLRKRLHNHCIFPKKHIRFIAAELVEALGFLHSCGVVYRDLKAENVLIDSEGHATLTDFGICKDVGQMEGGRTNSFCGTPSHLAPEVILHQSYSYEVDWWSLGVLLYEMATGTNPFFHENVHQCFQNVLNRKIVFPEILLSKDLISLLQGLLTREPQQRMKEDEIRRHPFFKEINWTKLCLRQIKSPIKPLPEGAFLDDTAELTMNELTRDMTGEFSHIAEFTFVDGTHEINSPSRGDSLQ